MDRHGPENSHLERSFGPTMDQRPPRSPHPDRAPFPCLCALALGVLALAAPRATAADQAQEYVSDLLVFAGSDRDGHVGFILDTNRGRDDGELQAEHFVALFVEGEGWKELEGGGAYPNRSDDVTSLPDSPSFSFVGDLVTGLQVRSAPNDLELRVAPCTVILERSHEGARFEIGEGGGTLTLGSRRIRGRVHHEYCYLPDKNLIVETYPDLFSGGWNGLYAVTADNSPVRLHATGGSLERLLGKTEGFAALSHRAARAERPKFEASRWSQAFGFFKWPGRWRFNWTEGPQALRLDVRLDHYNVLAKWGIGGAALAVARGTITVEGRETEVFGLAQVIR